MAPPPPPQHACPAPPPAAVLPLRTAHQTIPVTEMVLAARGAEAQAISGPHIRFWRAHDSAASSSIDEHRHQQQQQDFSLLPSLGMVPGGDHTSGHISSCAAGRLEGGCLPGGSARSLLLLWPAVGEVHCTRTDRPGGARTVTPIASAIGPLSGMASWAWPAQVQADRQAGSSRPPVGSCSALCRTTVVISASLHACGPCGRSGEGGAGVCRAPAQDRRCQGQMPELWSCCRKEKHSGQGQAVVLSGGHHPLLCAVRSCWCRR